MRNPLEVGVSPSRVWHELGGIPLFKLCKKLVALRKNHPALKIGEFFTQFIDQKNNVYSYLRRSESQSFKFSALPLLS